MEERTVFEEGDVVIAKRHLEAVGTTVNKGTKGVIFRANDLPLCSENLVIWRTGVMCTVCGADITKIEADHKRPQGKYDLFVLIDMIVDGKTD